jgi:hypothetical protein
VRDAPIKQETQAATRNGPRALNSVGGNKIGCDKTWHSRAEKQIGAWDGQNRDRRSIPWRHRSRTPAGRKLTPKKRGRQQENANPPPRTSRAGKRLGVRTQQENQACEKTKTGSWVPHRSIESGVLVLDRTTQ